MHPGPSLIVIFGALCGLAAAPISAYDAKAQALVFSPWIKNCLRDAEGKQTTCFIGRLVHTKCGSFVASAMLSEQAGENKKTLQVATPIAAAQRGVRVTIDQGQPMTLPPRCGGNGCTADYEAGADLVARLKQGQTLMLEAVDPADGGVRVAVPLAGFADAYDGPRATHKVTGIILGSADDAQRRAEEEKRRLAECEAGQ
jgi:invasion protein IalB